MNLDSWDEWVMDAINFVMMKIFLPVIFVLGFGFFFIAIPWLIHEVWYESTHACTKWTEPYYHPPAYQMVGKTMVPFGGGAYSDCVEREK